MARLRLTLAYVGTDFRGWQYQDNDRTVQGCLEEALTRLAGTPIRVHGAGRTDSGVHALGQVAHADIPDERMDLPWRRALNAILPQDMAVLETSWANPTFHARYSATSKIYFYDLWTEADYILPQRRPYTWRTGPLDLSTMRQAAGFLTGTHDFAAFQNTGTEVQSTTRTIHSIEIESAHPEIRLTFHADGFLKQMVRNLVGCLVEIGKYKLEPIAAARLLDAHDRTQAPATAPAQGLTLHRVFY